jgi:hypothetical protein
MAFERTEYPRKALEEDRQDKYGRTQPAVKRQLHRPDIVVDRPADDKISGPEQYAEH